MNAVSHPQPRLMSVCEVTAYVGPPAPPPYRPACGYRHGPGEEGGRKRCPAVDPVRAQHVRDHCRRVERHVIDGLMLPAIRDPSAHTRLQAFSGQVLQPGTEVGAPVALVDVQRKGKQLECVLVGFEGQLLPHTAPGHRMYVGRVPAGRVDVT
jgi:hypothetical protein